MHDELTGAASLADLAAQLQATASGFSLPYDEAIAQGFSEHPLPTWEESPQAPILTASPQERAPVTVAARPRERRPAGRARPKSPKRGDPSGSDDDPPRSELARTAAASLRLAARIARRQRRRMRHERASVAA